MEFSFNVEKILKCDSDGLAILTPQSINNSNNKYISTVIDYIGAASSKVLCSKTGTRS